MTSRKVTTCDRCGKEIGRLELRLVSVKRFKVIGSDKDMCNACTNGFRRLFDRWWKEGMA